MPYLTPENLPEERDCRALLIPADPEWLALVSGALTELTKSWNWQQWGALTVEETVEEMNAIIYGYYNEPCGGSCPKIIRIGIDGSPEQSLDGGETWEETTGAEAVPPMTPRTEPTPEERRCLAAANAANVLMLVYEDWTDTWAGDNNLALVASNFAILVAGLIGAWLGLITAAAINLAIFVWGEITAILNQVTVDMWDSDFTDLVKCAFYENSTDITGVVTFDYQGFLQTLFDRGEQSPNPIEYGLLIAQINYVVYFIGAAGLNHAGETTAIEEVDCEDCAPEWCYDFDFASGAQGFVANGTCPQALTGGVWVGATCSAIGNAARIWIEVHITFPAGSVLTNMTLTINNSYTGTGYARNFMKNGAYRASIAGAVGSGVQYPGINVSESANGTYGVLWDTPPGYSPTQLPRLRMSGTGENPFGVSNC